MERGNANVEEGHEENRKPFVVCVSVPLDRRGNLGPLLRCCCAFGAEEVIVIGASKFSTHGAHGSNFHVPSRICSSWNEAKRLFGVSSNVLGIVGDPVEGISVASSDVLFENDLTVFVLNHDRCLVPGDEAWGICNGFVHVEKARQRPLDSAIVLSIVMHQFVCWAGYWEHSRSGSKFNVNRVPKGMLTDGMRKALADQRERARRERELDAEGTLDSISLMLL